MGVLWIFFAITSVFAVERQPALEQFVLVSKIFLMVFLSISMVNTRERNIWLLRVMALALGLYALKGAIFFLGTGGQGMVEAPEGSYLTANNALGIALVMNVPLLFYLMKEDSFFWLRRLFKAMFLASYPAVIGTFSRGAWMGLAVVTLVLLWKTKREAIRLIGAAALCAPLLAIILMLFPGIGSKIFSSRVIERYETLENVDEDATSQQRFDSWEYCKRVGFANPIVGAGFAYYSRDSIARYYPELWIRWPGKVWSCHSSWLTVLGEHGVLGLLLWVGLLISSFRSLRQIRIHGRRFPEAAWVVDLSGIIQMSLLGYIVAGTFLDFAYFDGYYQLVAVIIATKEVLYGVHPIRVLSEEAVGRVARGSVMNPSMQH